MRHLIGLLVLVGACGGDPPLHARFLAKVRGSSAALDAFAVVSPDLQTDGKVIFSNGFLTRTFTSPLPLAGLTGQKLVLSAQAGEQLTDTLTLTPYVCADAGLLGGSATIQEEHQVYLDRAGMLNVDTDFEHRLQYSCTVVDSSGKSGQGVSTLRHAPALCADEASRGTTTAVRGTFGGKPVANSFHTCEAVLSDRRSGEVLLTFEAPIEGHVLTVNTSHCLPAMVADFPKVLTLTGDRCPSGLDVTLTPAGAEPRPMQASGTWVIQQADFSKGGRLRGRISIEAAAADVSLVIEGDVDLPLLRVPVEGDWPI